MDSMVVQELKVHCWQVYNYKGIHRDITIPESYLVTDSDVRLLYSQHLAQQVNYHYLTQHGA
jgi:hypothetical protein